VEEFYLIYMKETHTESGVMPPYYIEAGPDDVHLWLADGGVDVTDDRDAWTEHNRRIEADHLALL
jgi:hypothetical protein